MPFSTACSTPLSNFEAGQNYKDVVDPAGIVFYAQTFNLLYFFAGCRGNLETQGTSSWPNLLFTDDSESFTNFLTVMLITLANPLHFSALQS